MEKLRTEATLEKLYSKSANSQDTSSPPRAAHQSEVARSVKNSARVRAIGAELLRRGLHLDQLPGDTKRHKIPLYRTRESELTAVKLSRAIALWACLWRILHVNCVTCRIRNSCKSLENRDAKSSRFPVPLLFVQMFGVSDVERERVQ